MILRSHDDHDDDYDENARVDDDDNQLSFKSSPSQFFVKPFQSHILRQKCKSMMVSCKTLLTDTIEIKNQLFPTTKTNFEGGLLVHTI